jgi:hypothetical protein
VRLHNRVLRRLGGTSLVTRFVDVEAAIPKQGRYRSDVCHFSAKGLKLFAKVIVPALFEAHGAVAARSVERHDPPK